MAGEPAWLPHDGRSFLIWQANRHGFHTTVHHMFEPEGQAAGLGGDKHDFTKEAYGPHGTHVDTTKPFRVHAFFDTGATTDRLSNVRIDIQGEQVLTVYHIW